MKYSLFVLLFFSIIGDTIFNDKFIYWDDGFFLKKCHFKGKPELASTYSAVSYTGFSKSLFFEGSFVSVEIKSYFNCEKSWIKMELATIELLRHEQTHFNITEMYRRKLNEELLSFKFNMPKVKHQFDSIYEQSKSKLKFFQEKYDLETSYGTDSTMQRNWDILVLDKIKSLSSFDMQKYTIDLSP